ncbi:MAG: flagellar M-ring protein FliF [Myxococcales bacterium]|nr:flagellar M-ring protein FliF [Myxococcales bacterium]
MQGFVERLSAFWVALDPAQRFQFGALAMVTLAILIGVGAWSATPRWTPVLEGQPYDELLRAAAGLDEAEIAFHIENGSLMVDAPKVGAARRALATTSDLPGLKDVSEMQLGLTPKAQAWAFMRALEGDLARGINDISGVAKSRVHVVPPREALFLDEKEPARASVFVHSEPGHSLSRDQVRAITNLVAGAVDGLTADRVALIDDNGSLLTESVDMDGTARPSELPTELLAYRSQLERRYVQIVKQALDPVLGFDGSYSVTSTVDIDMTSSETISKRIDTKGQAIVEENIEESNAETEKAGGVPGVDANLPERPAAANSGTTREESSTIGSRFEYPTVDEVSRRPAGGVKRVSVSVQVDSAKVEGLAEAAGVGADEVQKKIERAVMAAVHPDEARNDSVSVHFMPFSHVEFEDVGATGGVAAVDVATSTLPYVVAGLAIVLAFLFVVRPLMTAITAAPTPKAPLEEERELARSEQDEDEHITMRLRKLIDDFHPVDSQELSALVDQQPNAAAKVLKQWQRFG